MDPAKKKLTIEYVVDMAFAGQEMGATVEECQMAVHERWTVEQLREYIKQKEKPQ